MTEGSRMAGRLCWLPHITFDSDHGWLCSQTGRAPFPAQGLSLWRKTIFRGRTQTSSSCCHWNNCLPSSPLSPVTLSRPQLVTKQKQKPNEITYKCPMCAWGFRVRREGRRGAIEVGGEGWKERGFWKEDIEVKCCSHSVIPYMLSAWLLSQLMLILITLKM